MTSFDLKIPKCFIDNTQTYLEKSSQIGEWFLEHYEKTDNKDDYIKLAEVYEEFKGELDGLYQSMSRTEQAKWGKNNFIQHFIDDPFLGENYVENGHVCIDEKRIHIRNVLIGYKKRETKNEEEEEEKNSEEDAIKNAVSIVIQNQS